MMIPEKYNNVPCVYFIRESDGEYIKIGVTKDIEYRINALQTGNPRKLEVVALIQFENVQLAYMHEKKLHALFSDIRRCGEWFCANEVLCHIQKNIDVFEQLGFLSEEYKQETTNGILQMGK